MSFSRTILTAGTAAIGLAVAASGLAIAFDPWGESRWSYMKGAESVPALGNNQGVYVDKGTFKLALGAAQGSDPVALIAKMGGKEVANGAVIFRSGDKLYILDGKPLGN
ncbi:MAG: hypothetical protein AB7O44_08545 [Hyphomicrobiaceae bacterium]|jgi:hypothetical protein